MHKLADLMETNQDKLAALEALDNGEWAAMIRPQHRYLLSRCGP